MDEKQKAALNEILVRLTDYRPSVLYEGVICDVDEYEVIGSNVDKEKGNLIYDINPVARRLSAQGGLPIPASSRERHINDLEFVTELELNLMRERGVTITIIP